MILTENSLIILGTENGGGAYQFCNIAIGTTLGGKGKNLYEPEIISEYGFEYFSIGRPHM